MDFVRMEPEKVTFKKVPDYTGRGPVFITIEGAEYGPAEINHDPNDINLCSSIIKISDEKYVEATYSLNNVENIDSADLSYIDMYYKKT